MNYVPGLSAALLLAGALVSASTAAEPAPWYRWQSLADEHIICRQNPPGKGWIRVGGPYKNAQCGRFAVDVLVNRAWGLRLSKISASETKASVPKASETNAARHSAAGAWADAWAAAMSSGPISLAN